MTDTTTRHDHRRHLLRHVERGRTPSAGRAHRAGLGAATAATSTRCSRPTATPALSEMVGTASTPSSPATGSAAPATSTSTTTRCGSPGSWPRPTAPSPSPASTSARSATTAGCAASPASSATSRPLSGSPVATGGWNGGVFGVEPPPVRGRSPRGGRVGPGDGAAAAGALPPQRTSSCDVEQPRARGVVGDVVHRTAELELRRRRRRSPDRARGRAVSRPTDTSEPSRRVTRRSMPSSGSTEQAVVGEVGLGDVVHRACDRRSSAPQFVVRRTATCVAVDPCGGEVVAPYRPGRPRPAQRRRRAAAPGHRCSSRRRWSAVRRHGRGVAVRGARRRRAVGRQWQDVTARRLAAPLDQTGRRRASGRGRRETSDRLGRSSQVAER